MKQLIGHDIGTYSFDASVKTIAISGVALTVEQINLVVNKTAGNIMLYNFIAGPEFGGSLTDGVLTLTASCSGMNNTDSLQIYVDVPNTPQIVSGPLTNTELRTEDLKITLDSEQIEISNFPTSQVVTGPLTDTELRASDVKITLDNEQVAVIGPLTNTQLRNSPVEVKIPSTVNADIGLPGSERKAAPFGYTMEEVTDITEPGEQIPVAVAPAMPGQLPVSMAMPVALANEQIFDLQGPIISKLNPAVGNNLVIQDCIQYRQVALQVITGAGISAGVLTFEGSNGGDNQTTWTTVPLFDQAVPTTAAVTTVTLAASTNRYFVGPLNFRYFRVRVSTAVAGGLVSCLPIFRMTPFSPVTNQVAAASNWSSNTAQWGGTAIVTGGVNGSVGVGGNQAVAATTTTNPVQIAGSDYNLKIRRLLSDDQGHQIVAGADPLRMTNPIKVVDDPGNKGRWNQSELLELILMELKLQSFYLKELPIILSTPNGTFIEEINNFVDNVDKITNTQ
jgi:hypothetical protein